MQEDEERYKGSVALNVYAKYFKAGNGYIMVTLFLFLICLDRVCHISNHTIVYVKIIILSFTRTQFGDD